MANSRSRRRQRKRNIAGEAAAAVVLGCVCALLGTGIASNYLMEHNIREVTVSVSSDFSSNAKSYNENYTAASIEKIEVGTKAQGDVAQVEAYVTPEVTPASQFPDSDFVFPQSSNVVLSDIDLASLMDPSTCQRAVKEIYARHGYDFYGEESTPEYQYFIGKDWYQALEKKNLTEVMLEFSYEESTNAALIDNYRMLMGW